MTDSAKAQRDVEDVMLQLQNWAIKDWEEVRPGCDFIRECIPDLAEKYIYFVIPDRAETSASVTKKQLVDIEKHGLKLLDALRSVQGPAINALNFRKPTLGEFEAKLEKLVEAAAQATKSATKTNSGPKVNVQPYAVAVAAALDFPKLTMARPTLTVDQVDGKPKTSGAFLDFLSKIFIAVGITASAEYYAKRALSAARRHSPKNQSE